MVFIVLIIGILTGAAIDNQYPNFGETITQQERK